MRGVREELEHAEKRNPSGCANAAWSEQASLKEAEKARREVGVMVKLAVWMWTVPELEFREIGEWARMWRDGTSAEDTKVKHEKRSSEQT